MAIWQFSIGLIPKVWAEKNLFDCEVLWDHKEGWFDCSNAWKNHQLKEDFTTIFSQILPPSKSTLENMFFWGNERESDVCVSFENNMVESIRLRIDLRCDFREIMAKFVAAARELECYFLFYSQRKIVEPNMFLLREAIANSRAMKFVSNPKTFLQNLFAGEDEG